MQKGKKRFEQVPVDEVIRLLDKKTRATDQSEGRADREDSRPVRKPAATAGNVQKRGAKQAICAGEEHPSGLHR